MNYLTNIPEEAKDNGLCKVLIVRYEMINIKHIFTEIFVRKTIDIEKYLKYLGWTLFDYIEYMTNIQRKIHYFSREYINDLDEIVKNNRDHFFPTIELYKGLNNCIILDFDGVCTEYQFNKNLYPLCIEREKTFICSANPNVSDAWFIKNNLELPSHIYNCKGKEKKIKALIHLNQKYDNIFYVDNEEEYLEFAWIFGIKTFIYKNKQIKQFSLNSK